MHWRIFCQRFLWNGHNSFLLEFLHWKLVPLLNWEASITVNQLSLSSIKFLHQSNWFIFSLIYVAYIKTFFQNLIVRLDLMVAPILEDPPQQLQQRSQHQHPPQQMEDQEASVQEDIWMSVSPCVPHNLQIFSRTVSINAWKTVLEY